MRFVAGYYRISVEKGSQVEHQRTLVEEAVKQDPWLRQFPFVPFLDVGYSGGTTRRPALQRLMAAVASDEVAAVVVKDFSRLSRDHLFLEDCQKNLFPKTKTTLISLTEQYDSRSPEAEEWMLLQGLVHQWYGQDVAEKVRALRAKQVQAGIHWGRAPYGYRKEAGQMVIQEEEAAVVRQLFFWQSQGFTTGEMAQMLQQSGIQTPKREGVWTRNKVWRLLHAPCYDGTMVLGAWEKPVYFSRRQRKKQPQLWHQIERRYPPLAPAILPPEARTQGHPPHPFRGRIFCGGCGQPMVRRWGSYASFTCPRRSQGGPCPAGTLRQDRVAEAVRQVEERLYLAKYGETKAARRQRQEAYAATIQKTLEQEEEQFGWLFRVVYEGPEHFRILMKRNWNQWI